MMESGKRRFCGGTAPTYLRVAFQNSDGDAGGSEGNRCRKAIRARTDNGGGWHRAISRLRRREFTSSFR